MKKGFTFIEVLIALSVLAISMLGIYSILNSSINMTTRAKSRLLLIDKGYERVLKHVYYPRLSLPTEETEPWGTVRFTYETSQTFLPGLNQVIMRAESDTATVIYEYFERVR